jgi:hypothetical protein
MVRVERGRERDLAAFGAGESVDDDDAGFPIGCASARRRWWPREADRSLNSSAAVRSARYASGCARTAWEKGTTLRDLGSRRSGGKPGLRRSAAEERSRRRQGWQVAAKA